MPRRYAKTALKLHQFAQQVLCHLIINQLGGWRIENDVCERDWETVLYCSDKCRAGTPKPR